MLILIHFYLSQHLTPLQMEKPRYLKGYKLDDEKIKKKYPPGEGDEDDPSYHVEWYIPILDVVPPTAYKEVTLGAEPDGTLITVIVLESSKDWRKSPFKRMMKFLLRWPSNFLHPVSGCASGEKVMLLAVLLFHHSGQYCRICEELS